MAEQLTFDGFANLVKKTGLSRDPRTHATYLNNQVSEAELVAAFQTTWLARRIVCTVAEDATREWRGWKAASEDITDLEDLEKLLGVQSAVKQALITARLLGGAAVYMSVAGDEGRVAEELVADRMKRGALRKLTVIGKDRLKVDADSVSDDPDSIYYGEPELYSLRLKNGESRLIHQSRLVRFWGSERVELPYQSTTHQQGWADSCLRPILDAIKDTDGAMANLAAMIYEGKTDVVKIKNLMSSMMANPDYERTVVERFRLAAEMKGVNGMLLLDEQDQWEQKQMGYGGLPDVVDRFFQWVSGAAGIPVTRLFMRSPAGLNATGASDVRLYYDNVRNLQTNDIAPELDKLDRALKATTFGRVRDDVYYEWNSLWQPTFDEKAASSRTIADVAKILVDSRLVSPEAVGEAITNTLVEIGAFSGLEQATKDYEAPTEEEEAAALPTPQLQIAAGDALTAKTQPRWPAGSSKGGQFAPKGSGPGGAGIMAALNSVATAKYGPDKIAELTQKDPKSLSHYEKKKLAAYNKALKAQGVGGPAGGPGAGGPAADAAPGSDGRCRARGPGSDGGPERRQGACDAQVWGRENSCADGKRPEVLVPV